MLKTTTWTTLIVSEEDSPKFLRLPWAPSIIFGKRAIKSTESPRSASETAWVAASETAWICSVVSEVETGGVDLPELLVLLDSLLELEFERLDWVLQ